MSLEVNSNNPRHRSVAYLIFSAIVTAALLLCSTASRVSARPAHRAAEVEQSAASRAAAAEPAAVSQPLQPKPSLLIQEVDGGHIPVTISAPTDDSEAFPDTLRNLCRTPCSFNVPHGTLLMKAGGLDSGIGTRTTLLDVPPAGLGVVVRAPSPKAKGAGVALIVIGAIALQLGPGIVLSGVMDGDKSGVLRTSGSFVGVAGLGMLIPGIVHVATNKPSVERTFPLSGE